MELFDYQERGIEFIAKNKRVYVAFDMGMGKTLTSLAAAHRLSDRSILVVAEKNEIVNSENFRKEVETYFPDMAYFSLREVEIDDLPEGRNVCGINPDALVKLDPKKVAKRFGAVIVDEATLAKNTATDRFKKLLKICDMVQYVALLSGTPMMNGASEIFAPLVIGGHWLGGDGTKKCREAFEKIFAGGYLKRIKFTGIYWQDFVWTAKGANYVRELRWLTKDVFVFERKQDTDVFKKKVREIHQIPMSAEWVSEYESAWSEYLGRVGKHNKMVSKDEMKDMENIKELQSVIENGQMIQVNSKWKARAIVKDIKAGMYGDKRIIVWSMFIETDEIFQEELRKAKISFRTFEDVKEWKKGTEQVLVGKIKSHGKGGNAPEACVALFADMDFVPTMNLQAENRMDRPEQKNEMLVRYYQTKEETVDQHVQKINKDKMRKIEKFTAPFTEEELKTLPGMVEILIRKFRKEFQILATSAGVTNIPGL